MRRVREFESWEESKRKEMFSIRTKAAPGIYFLPKEHCEETRAAHDESMEAIEAEIKEMKEKFEEDLLKIEERAKDPRGVSCELELYCYGSFCVWKVLFIGSS